MTIATQITNCQEINKYSDEPLRLWRNYVDNFYIVSINLKTLQKMGRYYTGDIDGKFMFAVQNSDAGERFGAVSQESNYIDYVVHKEDSYEDICKELNDIEQTGCIKRVTKMFDNEVGYNDDICKKYGVSQEDLMEFADYRMGKQIKEWFDNNPTETQLNFEAEL